MAYVISTFDDRYQTDSVVANLKDLGLQDVDYAVTDRTDTMKGWFQRLFGLGDDAQKLVSKGVPPQEAQAYDDQLETGRVLLVARSDQSAPRVAQLLRERGARDVRVYAERGGAWERVPEANLATEKWDELYTREASLPAGGPALEAPTVRGAGAALADRPPASDEERRIPVREEELRTGTREREAGEVTVRKDVVETPVHEDVPLSRERVRIERRPLRDVLSGTAEPIREGDTIRVPLAEEEAVVEKRPVVTEEIVISKERETYTQPVDETVKKERVRVEGDQDRVQSDIDEPG